MTSEKREKERPAAAWRDGWRSALSGQAREVCRYTTAAERESWDAGYGEAESCRPDDVAAVRAAVSRTTGGTDG